MASLDNNIWHTSLKLWSYPVYGTKTWSPHLTTSEEFDQWCPYHILKIPWRASFPTEVCRHTNQPPLNHSDGHMHHLYHSVSSSSAKLHMPIHPWITVKPSGPAWTLCQETGTTHQDKHVTPGSGW